LINAIVIFENNLPQLTCSFYSMYSTYSVQYTVLLYYRILYMSLASEYAIAQGPLGWAHVQA